MPSTPTTEELSGLEHATSMLRQIDSRDKESFAYAQSVSKPWGGLEPMLAWCKSELEGDWRWQMVEMSTGSRPGRYIFYFDSARDVMAFTLKWS